MFDEDTVRVVGRSQPGLEAPTDFARLTFSCDKEGESPLTLSVRVWGDAAMPGEPRKVELQDATVTCGEPGQDGVIRVGFYEINVGEQVAVVLEAVDIPMPGLGAWIVDVTYDTSVVSLLDCDAQLGGVCNLEHGADTLRVTGASAGGLSGTAILANIVFACNLAGTTDLTLQLGIFTDASLGQDVLIPDPVNGAVTCTEASSVPLTELPSTGTAAPQPASLPAAVPLALLGAVLLAAAFAFRRYAAR